MNKLDLALLRRFWVLAKRYFQSAEKRTAWGMLALLLVLLLADTEFNVLFNEQSGEFTSALAAQDGPRFWRSIRMFFVLLVVAVPIYAYYYYVRDQLALRWRRWMTGEFLDRYFASRGYYRLLASPEIDNPDQRISEDIDAFTQRSLTFLLLLLSGIFQLVAFGRVLWMLSGYLVLFLVVYATAWTMITFGVFGEKMVTLNYNQRRREADFRFGLVRVRENAEAIALYQGEREERRHLQRFFGRLYANYDHLIRWTLRLNFFYYGNSLSTLVLPTLILAPRVLSGEMEVGRIVQATGAFTAILGALTILVDNLEPLSRFAAGIGRLEGLEKGLAPGESREDRIAVREGKSLRFDGVTLRTPNRERTLVRGLNVTIPPGEGLLIVGASGAGKSSLLRAMAGLWDAGEGVLERPPAGDMLFLPQHAYMVLGSLRAQLHYPNLDREVTEAELREVLEMVNLPQLLNQCGGFDEDFDFEKILSVGERQRLAFARVLLQHPRYVLLDEATSALDRANEMALYAKLRETSTTLVSVSHHASLVRYHTQVLELTGDGGWQVHPAGGFQFKEEMGECFQTVAERAGAGHDVLEMIPMLQAGFPGEDVVLAGVDRAMWAGLLAELAGECGAGEYEWKKYAKKAPWSLRVKREGRVIVYLLPGEGEFTASFALGGRALELAREAGLGALLDGAKKYAEGTAVRVLVRKKGDLAAVIGLARAKIAG